MGRDELRAHGRRELKEILVGVWCLLIIVGRIRVGEVDEAGVEVVRAEQLLRRAGRDDQPFVEQVDAILEEAEQLRLEREREITDLVQEQRASFCRGDFALGLRDGTREGAAGMTEQLALQQLGTQTRATHRDERSPRPLAPRMDRAGEDALAGPALTADQDDRLGPGHPARLLERRPDARILAVHRDFGDLAGELMLEVVHPALQVAELLQPLEDRPDLRGREGLGQVIESPSAHRLDGVINRPVGGDDHHGGPHRSSADFREEFQTRVGPEAKVDHRDVESLPVDRPKGFRGPGRLLDRVPHRLEGHAEHLADIQFVVDDEDSHGPGAIRLEASLPASIVVTLDPVS